MSIRCFFGIHDYEPFGDGVKLLDILERSAQIKADALYIPESKDEIYEFIKANIRDSDKKIVNVHMREFILENKSIRDEVCLRCGKIKSNIQKRRKKADDYAVLLGMAIILSIKRQKKAKEMLYERTKMSNCI